jgi:hypothetical protein
MIYQPKKWWFSITLLDCQVRYLILSFPYEYPNIPLKSMKIRRFFRGFILSSLATHGSGQLADLLQCATIGGVEGAGCAEI